MKMIHLLYHFHENDTPPESKDLLHVKMIQIMKVIQILGVYHFHENHTKGVYHENDTPLESTQSRNSNYSPQI